MLGVTHLTFKPSLVYRHTRIPIYKKLAKPILSNDSESCRIPRTDKGRHISRNAIPGGWSVHCIEPHRNEQIVIRVLRYNHLLATCLLPASRWILAWLILRPWKFRRHVRRRRPLTSNGIYDIISQSTELFLTTAVRTSYPTNCEKTADSASNRTYTTTDKKLKRTCCRV
jgi:hypothetical protein